MAWRWPGDKQLSEPLNQWCLVYWRIYASLGLNELNVIKDIVKMNDIM